MIVYIIVAIILFFSLKIKETNEGLNKAIVVLLSFLGLFRDETVGLDVNLYISNIKRTTFNPYTWNYYTIFESGYNELIAFYNFFLPEYPMFFLGLTNVLFVYSIYMYGKCHTTKTILYFYLIFMFGFYMQSFNIMRQYFAISVFLLYLSKINFESMRKRDILICTCLTIAIGVFFHNSAFILILLIIYQSRLIKNLHKIWLFLLLVGSYLIFYLGLIKDMLAPLTNYFIINEKTNIYFNSAMNSIEPKDEYSIARLTLDTFFSFFVLWRTKKTDVYCFLFIMGQVYLNFIASLNPLFIRLSSWLFIIGMVVICKLYEESRFNKIVILLYCNLIFINILLKNYGKVIPYSLIF